MTAEERKALNARLKAKDEALVKEYDALMRANPTAPIYKWAQAQHDNESNIDLQGKLCQETVEMDGGEMRGPGLRSSGAEGQAFEVRGPRKGPEKGQAFEVQALAGDEGPCLRGV